MGGEKCKRCNDPISFDAISVKCYGSCNGVYHLECSNLSHRTFKAKSEAEKRKWVCVSCRDKKKREKAADRETEESKDTESESTDEEEGRKPKNQKFSLEEKIDLIMLEQKRTNNLILEFRNTVGALQAELEEKNKIISDLKEELNDFKQHYRSNYIELHNVKSSSNETEKELEDITIKVCQEIGIEIVSNDIEAIHRIQTKAASKQKPIIVQLQSRKKKNAILEAKKGKKVTQDMIQNNGKKEEQIFICESLTKENKELLFHTKEAAKEKGYKFVWTKHGKILARKNEYSKPVQIKKNEDIALKL